MQSEQDRPEARPKRKPVVSVLMDTASDILLLKKTHGKASRSLLRKSAILLVSANRVFCGFFFDTQAIPVQNVDSKLEFKVKTVEFTDMSNTYDGLTRPARRNRN